MNTVFIPLMYLYSSHFHPRPFINHTVLVQLLVQGFLFGPAVILAALLVGHLLGHGRPRLRVVRGKLGVDALLDGLDRELLLALCLLSAAVPPG